MPRIRLIQLLLIFALPVLLGVSDNEVKEDNIYIQDILDKSLQIGTPAASVLQSLRKYNKNFSITNSCNHELEDKLTPCDMKNAYSGIAMITLPSGKKHKKQYQAQIYLTFDKHQKLINVFFEIYYQGDYY